MARPPLWVPARAFADRNSRRVVGYPVAPLAPALQHADNPFATEGPGVGGAVGYALIHQIKSTDWRVRNS